MRTPSTAATMFTLKFRTKNAFRSVDSDLTTHSMILDSISRRFVVTILDTILDSENTELHSSSSLSLCIFLSSLFSEPPVDT